MTYPRTPEEKARQLGARFACAAFNACGNLDAKKCQEMGDDLGKAIAQLIAEPKPNRLPPDEDPGPFQCLMGCGAEVPEWMVCYTCYPPGQGEPLSPEAALALAAGLEAEPAYMRCFVCKTPRDRQVRELCGHDAESGGERRWYCSRKCFDQ